MVTKPQFNRFYLLYVIVFILFLACTIPAAAVDMRIDFTKNYQWRHSNVSTLEAIDLWNPSVSWIQMTSTAGNNLDNQTIHFPTIVTLDRQFLTTTGTFNGVTLTVNATAMTHYQTGMSAKPDFRIYITPTIPTFDLKVPGKTGNPMVFKYNTNWDKNNTTGLSGLFNSMDNILLYNDGGMAFVKPNPFTSYFDLYSFNSNDINDTLAMNLVPLTTYTTDQAEAQYFGGHYSGTTAGTGKYFAGAMYHNETANSTTVLALTPVVVLNGPTPINWTNTTGTFTKTGSPFFWNVSDVQSIKLNFTGTNPDLGTIKKTSYLIINNTAQYTMYMEIDVNKLAQNASSRWQTSFNPGTQVIDLMYQAIEKDVGVGMPFEYYLQAGNIPRTAPPSTWYDISITPGHGISGYNNGTAFNGKSIIVPHPSLETLINGTYDIYLMGLDQNNDIVALDQGEVFIGTNGGPAAPVASFGATPTSGPAPLPVQFTDTSTNTPTMWNWSFGDNSWFNTTDSASRNKTHVYRTANTYSVSLTASNAAGSDTSSLTTITVSAPYTGSVAMFRAYSNHNGTYDNGGIQPTNNLKWVNNTGNGIISSPAVANGVVYIGDEGGKVHALDEGTGAFLWNYTTAGSISSSPAVANGVVYVGSQDANVYALDATTGAKIWNFTTYQVIDTSPAVKNGVVYIVDLGGNVYALNAATGGEIWSFSSMGHGHSSPAFANGTVYVAAPGMGASPDVIWALNPTDGSVLWHNDLLVGTMFASPAIGYQGTMLYIGSGNNLTALCTLNNTIVWQYETRDRILSSPAISNGMVYFFSEDNNVTALDALTGEKNWNYTIGSGTTSGSFDSSPAVANGRVYIGGWDNNVYALNALTGAEIWHHPTSGAVYSSPVVDSGTVYVGSDDGKVYAIGGGGGQVPIVNFAANLTQGGYNHTVLFSDLSTGTPLSWNWSFGDGQWFNTTVGGDPVHTYTQTDDTRRWYDVSLNVTNANGVNTTLKTNYIHVKSFSEYYRDISFSSPPGNITTGTFVQTIEDWRLLRHVSTFTGYPSTGVFVGIIEDWRLLRPLI